MNPFDSSYGPAMQSAAARIDQTAAELRARAGRLRGANASCEWDGAGARAFRSSAAATCTRVERASRLLDEAAAALRAHGSVVADALAEDAARRARVERELVERAADVLHVPRPGHGR